MIWTATICKPCWMAAARRAPEHRFARSDAADTGCVGSKVLLGRPDRIWMPMSLWPSWSAPQVCNISAADSRAASTLEMLTPPRPWQPCAHSCGLCTQSTTSTNLCRAVDATGASCLTRLSQGSALGVRRRKSHSVQAIYFPSENERQTSQVAQAVQILEKGAITFTMASSLTFCYLRDALATSIDTQSLPQRLYYVIIDEADHVLIDLAGISSQLSMPDTELWNDEIQQNARIASAVAQGIACMQLKVGRPRT
jgi:hypothetical protein